MAAPMLFLVSVLLPYSVWQVYPPPLPSQVSPPTPWQGPPTPNASARLWLEERHQEKLAVRLRAIACRQKQLHNATRTSTATNFDSLGWFVSFLSVQLPTASIPSFELPQLRSPSFLDLPSFELPSLDGVSAALYKLLDAVPSVTLSTLTSHWREVAANYFDVPCVADAHQSGLIVWDGGHGGMHVYFPWLVLSLPICGLVARAWIRHRRYCNAPF